LIESSPAVSTASADGRDAIFPKSCSNAINHLTL
jgi:hypothetical protein